MRWFTPGINFFVIPKNQHHKDIQDKMKGLWELKQFYFDNKPWKEDLNPKGKIFFHEDSDLVFVAINTSHIANSKDDEEFFSRLIFYLANWGLSTNNKGQDVSEHDVLRASSQSRIGALEKRIIEITPEGYLKLSGIQPGTGKSIELIWMRPESKEEQQTVEPWMQPWVLESAPNSSNQLYGVMYLTPEGQLFFDTTTIEMEATPKMSPSSVLKNILFFTGAYKVESEIEDKIHLSCQIELSSNPFLHNQELKITTSKYSNGLVSFKVLDQEFVFTSSPVRSHIAHEHFNQNSI